MKKGLLALLVMGFICLLSACGVIQSFIPDQKVDNLLGVDELELTTELLPAQPEIPEVFLKEIPEVFLHDGLLESQASTRYVGLFTYQSINDYLDDLVFTPKVLEQDIYLSEVTLSSSKELSFPNRLDVAFSGAYVGVWDGFSKQNEQNPWASLSQERKAEILATYETAKSKDLTMFKRTDEARLVYVKASCSALSCNYKLETKESDVIKLVLSDAEVKKLFEIAQSAEAQNSGFVFAWLSVSGVGLEDGMSASVSLDTPAAVIKFQD